MTKERQPARLASPADTSAVEPSVTLESLAAQAGMLAEAVAWLSGVNPAPRTPPEAQLQPEVPAGEEVVDMVDHDDSLIVKAGSRAYFLDLMQTRDK